MRIHVVPGGPMLVEGIPVDTLRRDGDGYAIDPLETPEPCALCRCGRSRTMPFCDREEPYACFEEEPRDGPEPAPFRWDAPDPAGPPAVALKPTGLSASRAGHRSPTVIARSRPWIASRCAAAAPRAPNRCATGRTRWSATGPELR